MTMGFRTTSRTKPIMIGKLRTALAHEWTIHSELLNDELSTFIEHEGGKLAAEHGCHDDRVIAAGCAIMGLEQAGLQATSYPSRDATGRRVRDPFVLDTIIDDLRARTGKYPVRPQNASSWYLPSKFDA